MIEPTNDSRQRLAEPCPHGFRALIGAVIGTGLLFGLLGGTVWLALTNIADFYHTPIKSILASLIWVGFVGLLFGGLIYEYGAASIGMRWLYLFSQTRYLEIDYSHDCPRITFAFELLGRRFNRMVIQARAIKHIGWSWGQASSRAQKDMDDWSVCLRIRRKLVLPSNLDGAYRGAIIYYCIGPTAKKQVAENFGREVVEFLKQAGLEIEPDGIENRFRVRAVKPALEQSQ